jgi:hypothetical protein
MRNMAGVGDLVQRTRDGQAHVGYSVAGWSIGQVTLYVVCTMHKETRSVGFLVEPQNQGRQVSRFGPRNQQLRFGDLVTKPPRLFLRSGLKTMWATICRLCHKTNGRMKMVLDTHRDLAACFAWKQVGLGFPSLASRLAKARCGWCMWHHRGGRVEMKLKMDRSLWWAASDSSTPTLSFSMYYAPRAI